MSTPNPAAGPTRIYANHHEMLADPASNNSDRVNREQNSKTPEHPSTTSGN